MRARGSGERFERGRGDGRGEWEEAEECLIFQESFQEGIDFPYS